MNAVLIVPSFIEAAMLPRSGPSSINRSLLFTSIFIVWNGNHRILHHSRYSNLIIICIFHRTQTSTEPPPPHHYALRSRPFCRGPRQRPQVANWSSKRNKSTTSNGELRLSYDLEGIERSTSYSSCLGVLSKSFHVRHGRQTRRQLLRVRHV